MGGGGYIYNMNFFSWNTGVLRHSQEAVYPLVYSCRVKAKSDMYLCPLLLWTFSSSNLTIDVSFWGFQYDESIMVPNSQLS